jgi:hypothetical protein
MNGQLFARQHNRNFNQENKIYNILTSNTTIVYAEDKLSCSGHVIVATVVDADSLK